MEEKSLANKGIASLEEHDQIEMLFCNCNDNLKKGLYNMGTKTDKKFNNKVRRVVEMLVTI